MLDLCHCDNGPREADHNEDCPRWCAYGHDRPKPVPYRARATTITDPEFYTRVQEG